MNISELIEKMQAAQTEHGDIEVRVSSEVLQSADVEQGEEGQFPAYFDIVGQ